MYAKVRARCCLLWRTTGGYLYCIEMQPWSDKRRTDPISLRSMLFLFLNLDVLADDTTTPDLDPRNYRPRLRRPSPIIGTGAERAGCDHSSTARATLCRRSCSVACQHYSESRTLLVRRTGCRCDTSRRWRYLPYAVVGRLGFEPRTPGLKVRCSGQLSYRPTGGDATTVGRFIIAMFGFGLQHAPEFD